MAALHWARDRKMDRWLVVLFSNIVIVSATGCIRELQNNPPCEGVDSIAENCCKTNKHPSEYTTIGIKVFHDVTLFDFDYSDSGSVVVGALKSESEIKGSTYLASKRDVFVKSIDAFGGEVWSCTFGGIQGYNAARVHLTEDNDTYLYAPLVGSVVNSKCITGEPSSFCNSDRCSVVAKIDHMGKVINHSLLGGYLTSLSMGTEDNIYVAGRFRDPIVFSLGMKAMVGGYLSKGGTDMFLARLNSNLGYEWLKVIGGRYNDGIDNITKTEDEHFLISGYFNGEVNFIQPPRSLRIKSRGEDLFVAKIDEHGEPQWLTTIGGKNSGIWPSYTASSDDGGYMICGEYHGKITHLTNGMQWQLESHGNELDLFVAKVSSDGDLVWMKGFGGPRRDTCGGLDVDSEGNTYVAINYFGELFLDKNSMVVGRGEHSNLTIVQMRSEKTYEVIANIGGSGSVGSMSVETLSDGRIIVLGVYDGNVFMYRTMENRVVKVGDEGTSGSFLLYVN